MRPLAGATGMTAQFLKGNIATVCTVCRTPALRQRSQWISLLLLLLLLLLWEEEAIGQRVELIASVVAPLLEVMQVADHVGIGSLPSCGARVVIDVIHAPTWIHAPLPSEE